MAHLECAFTNDDTLDAKAFGLVAKVELNSLVHQPVMQIIV
jgi:hypothetical protein